MKCRVPKNTTTRHKKQRLQPKPIRSIRMINIAQTQSASEGHGERGVAVAHVGILVPARLFLQLVGDRTGAGSLPAEGLSRSKETGGKQLDTNSGKATNLDRGLERASSSLARVRRQGFVLQTDQHSCARKTCSTDRPWSKSSGSSQCSHDGSTGRLSWNRGTSQCMSRPARNQC